MGFSRSPVLFISECTVFYSCFCNWISFCILFINSKIIISAPWWNGTWSPGGPIPPSTTSPRVAPFSPQGSFVLNSPGVMVMTTSRLHPCRREQFRAALVVPAARTAEPKELTGIAQRRWTETTTLAGESLICRQLSIWDRPHSSTTLKKDPDWVLCHPTTAWEARRIWWMSSCRSLCGSIDSWQERCEWAMLGGRTGICPPSGQLPTPRLNFSISKLFFHDQ